MEILAKILGYARPVSHLVVWIATATFLLLALAHELGHAIAGRAVGLREMSLILLPGRRAPRKSGILNFFARYAATAAIEFSDEEIASLSWNRRRLVLIGGVAADVVVALIAFMWMPDPWAAPYWEHGIVLGAWLRVALGVPMNFVPIASVRNDGWYFMNPARLESWSRPTAPD